MNFFVDFLLTIHLINVKNKEKQCFSIALLAIVVRDKTNIIQLVAGKLGDQVLDVLPLLATHPGLQAAVEQSHVVVEHLVAGEPVPEPLVHLAPGVLALNLHRLVGILPTLLGWHLQRKNRSLRIGKKSRRISEPVIVRTFFLKWTSV